MGVGMAGKPQRDPALQQLRYAVALADTMGCAMKPTADSPTFLDGWRSK